MSRLISRTAYISIALSFCICALHKQLLCPQTRSVPTTAMDIRTMTRADVLKKVHEVLDKTIQARDKTVLTEFKQDIEKGAVSLTRTLKFWILLTPQAQNLVVNAMSESGMQTNIMRPEQIIQRYWPEFQAAVKRTKA